MQFKHPDLLYALLLLIIPVLIHLFQLRKFKKEAFTNLKFLQKISLQTRKSSQLKKWLVLCTRMLALAALIIAFCQPFFLTSETALQPTETVIYLDNSYSMQAKGAQGQLLPRALLELQESLPEDATFSLFTNNNMYPNVYLKDVRSDLQQIGFSETDLNFGQIKLRTAAAFSESKNTNKHFIAVSDFQESKGGINFEDINYKAQLVQMEPENRLNIAIDSAFVENPSAEEQILVVQLSSSENLEQNVPVSVYNHGKLIAKSAAAFSENKKTKVEFSLPQNEAFEGLVKIEDQNLQFDNQLFFSIEEQEPLKVVAINAAEDDFLEKIFNAPDFELQNFQAQQLDYSTLTNANVVVLNQLSNIPSALNSNLSLLAEKGVIILVIPAADVDVDSYNAFLAANNFPQLKQPKREEQLITKISYEHPLYKGVFDEKVNNFEYPKVSVFYELENAASGIIKYQDNRPFLLQKENIFLLTAPIDNENSNFKSSPLIVPTLFNIGKTGLKQQQLYYILGNNNQIDVPVQVQEDEILQIAGENSSFIPQQQSFYNKVSIITNELPSEPGNFSVLKNEKPVAKLSFNVNRKESVLHYSELNSSENVSLSPSFAEAFENVAAQNNINELWKIFAIFAMLFLIAEMLILKYVK